MKKDITIGAKLTGKYSIGEFENEGQEPLISITYKDVDNMPADDIVRADIDKAMEAQTQLTEALYQQMSVREALSRQKAIEKRYSEIRWREKNGKKYPSVTSIIYMGGSPYKSWVDEATLEGYQARGQIGDLLLQSFIKTGEWREPKQIAACVLWLKVTRTAGVAMTGDLPAFVQKYDAKFISGHSEVFNDEHFYAGEPDCILRFGDGPETVGDLKWFNPSGEDQALTYLVQLSAYAKCMGIEQIAILPVHGQTKQGFSQPIIRGKEKIDEYFDVFLGWRKNFKAIYKV